MPAAIVRNGAGLQGLGLLGVQQLSVRALLAVLVILVGFAPGHLTARELVLAPAACTTGADSVEAALSVPLSDLDCGKGRFALHDRFVRAHVALDRLGALPNARLTWETNPTSFTSMLIRLDYADGSQRIIDVDRQMAVRNWFANGNFWVTLNLSSAPLRAIDVVVERPQSGTVLSRMALSGVEEAATENYHRTLAAVLICGILLVPIIYNLLFYRVLRERFILWNVGMTAGTLLYVLFNSGLIILVWPTVGSLTRFAMIFIAGSLILICAVRFAAQILEEGSVNPRIARFTVGASVLSLVLAVLIPFDIEAIRLRVLPIYYLSLVPAIGGAVAMLALAVREGSRAAKFVLVALAPATAMGLAQVAQSFGLVNGQGMIDDLAYIALSIMVIGTAAAVGDRLLVIKGERDRARITAQRLGAMASSDGLTGLLNRRAFDRQRCLAKGCLLLLADLDRFKAINDNFGHQRGDAVLCHAARAIEAVVAGAPDASVYRMGGEEFAVLAAISEPVEAEALCEAIRLAVAATSKQAELHDLPPVTISIGGVLGRGQPMHTAYADADRALYRSKAAGRDRWEVVVA